MSTAKRNVQKPGATTPAPTTTDTTPAQATTPNALTPPIAAGSLVDASTDTGAYLPEQLANDERYELERLRAENLTLKQQQAALPATATKTTGPKPTAPAPVNQSKGGGTLTEHGWIVD